MEAYNQCQLLEIPFDETFQFQYLIRQSHDKVVGMERISFAGWQINVGRLLPTTRIFDKNNIQIALLLGIACDRDGILSGEKRFRHLDYKCSSFTEDFELELEFFAGRYLIVLDTPIGARIYSDPVGMIGVVYNAEEKTVASSTLLCIERKVIVDPMFDHNAISKGRGRYGLFHTQDKFVRRANPNTYLELNGFSECRFWPKKITIPYNNALKKTYEEIAALARCHIGAIASAHKCAFPLSGGKDSRVLLALAGGSMKEMNQIFSHINNYATRIDATIAKKLGESIGLNIEIHDKRNQKVTKEYLQHARRQWRIASGTNMPLPDGVRTGVITELSTASIVLRGQQVDFLRALFGFRSNKATWKDFRWQIKRLLFVPMSAFDKNVYKKFRPDFVAWYNGLNEVAKEKQLDFVLQELVQCTYLGTLFPGIHQHFFMSPFNSRRLLALCISIDDVYRRKYSVDDFIYLMQPILLETPYTVEFKGELSNINNDAFITEATKERLAGVHERAKHL